MTTSGDVRAKRADRAGSPTPSTNLFGNGWSAETSTPRRRHCWNARAGCGWMPMRSFEQSRARSRVRERPASGGGAIARLAADLCRSVRPDRLTPPLSCYGNPPAFPHRSAIAPSPVPPANRRFRCHLRGSWTACSQSVRQMSNGSLGCARPAAGLTDALLLGGKRIWSAGARAIRTAGGYGHGDRAFRRAGCRREAAVSVPALDGVTFRVRRSLPPVA